jgi:hypothetical protein
VKTVVATTGDERTAAAAAAVLEAGGNAVDAAVAAALAWPPALTSAGVMVALGPGMGHGAATFQARVPGYGLSRPSRLRLLSAAAPAADVATSCAAQALVAILGRWGTASVAEVARAAGGRASAAERKASPGPAPHEQALALLARDGVNAFSRGAFAVEAARSHGPLAGGLLTRRDMIEARPTIGSAEGPLNGLWLPWLLDDARQVLAAGSSARAEGGADERVLSVVVIDRHGAVAAVALEAGAPAEAELPGVAGVPPNTLLAGQPAARAKKVGQPLPLLRAAAAGGEVTQVALAGALAPALDLLDRADLAGEPRQGLLVVRRSPGGRVDVEGAAAVVRS